MLLAALSAAAPVVGWTIVGDAIDNGIRANDVEPAAARRRRVHRRRSERLGARHDDVADARRNRAADGARPAPQPVRPSDVAVAAVLLPAEGRLDHRAPHLRRRRALRRAQPGVDDARRQLVHARRRDRGPVSPRLEARPRRPARPATGHRRHALVPAHVARRVRRRPDADRRRHRAARRVRLGDGGRPGIQPRAGVPARVRRAERAQPRLQRLRAEAVGGVLPGDRVPRRHGLRARAVRGRQADRRRVARRSAR